MPPELRPKVSGVVGGVGTFRPGDLHEIVGASSRRVDLLVLPVREGPTPVARLDLLLQGQLPALGVLHLLTFPQAQASIRDADVSVVAFASISGDDLAFSRVTAQSLIDGGLQR